MTTHPRRRPRHPDTPTSSDASEQAAEAAAGAGAAQGRGRGTGPAAGAAFGEAATATGTGVGTEGQRAEGQAPTVAPGRRRGDARTSSGLPGTGDADPAPAVDFWSTGWITTTHQAPMASDPDGSPSAVTATDPPSQATGGHPPHAAAQPNAADDPDPADHPDAAASRSAAGAGVGACPSPGEWMRVGQMGGKSAHVRVTIPLTTLMGGEGGPGADLPGADDPADLEGYGPIPASVARALAAGGFWARLVTDPIDRTVLEITSDRYPGRPACVGRSKAGRRPDATKGETPDMGC